MAGSCMDISFQALRRALEFGIMSGWQTQRSDSGVCGTHTRSPVFVRNPRCAASSVTRRRVSSPLFGAQKKRSAAAAPACTRTDTTDACGGYAICPVTTQTHHPGDRGTARAAPKRRAREARAIRVPGGQPVLYQALCSLRRPALPAGNELRVLSALAHSAYVGGDEIVQRGDCIDSAYAWIHLE